MSDVMKKRRQAAEWIRDGVAVAGVASLAVGAGIQFGIGFGLITFGTVCLVLVILGSVRK